VTGKSSRAKGVNGERESADTFRRYGFEVVRLQNNVLDAGDFTATIDPRELFEIPTRGTRAAALAAFRTDGYVQLIVDSKRRERLNLVAASKQVEAVAHNGQVPCVVYRPNREPWRISALLEDFARLLGDAP